MVIGKAERVARVLDFVEEYTAENLCPPTVRQIQKKLKIKSTATVYDDITNLSAMGLVKKVGGKVAPTYTDSFKSKLLERLH